MVGVPGACHHKSHYSPPSSLPHTAGRPNDRALQGGVLRRTAPDHCSPAAALVFWRDEMRGRLWPVDTLPPSSSSMSPPPVLSALLCAAPQAPGGLSESSFRLSQVSLEKTPTDKFVVFIWNMSAYTFPVSAEIPKIRTLPKRLVITS